jgi:hypothetical protein
MSTSEPKAGERITSVRVTEDSLTIDLLDGRTMTVPLAWYPRLLHASERERNNFRMTSISHRRDFWPALLHPASLRCPVRSENQIV